MICAPPPKVSEQMECETLIIGGGLSGLRLAALLAERGDDFQVLEARDRFGGRILTETYENSSYDLGPAWFWPGQERMAHLIQRFGLQQFDQHAAGILAYEDETGGVQHGRGFASMEGSYRLHGGLGALIDAMVADLPKARLHLSHPVETLRWAETAIEVTTGAGRTVLARRVVLALPPRVAAGLSFAPALSDPAIRAMQIVATWMAGQAKAIAFYDTPFWREAGLSGDATSRRGPMVEIHDASPRTGGPAALFGFIGVPPHARRDKDALDKAIRAQLGRLFGPQAAKPKQLLVKDWAVDVFTSTKLDQQPLYNHPRYGRHPVLDSLWNRRLIFWGTEMGARFGGYLEGALEAAEDVAAMLAMEKV